MKPRWDTFEVSESERFPELEGRRVTALAEERGGSPFDVLCELALAEDLKTRFSRGHRQRRPGRGRPPARARPRRARPVGRRCPHRSAVRRPVVHRPTGELGRGRAVLPLETAVRKMTGEPADMFGFVRRGYLREGNWADVCVFDPATVGPGPLRRCPRLPGRRRAAHGRGADGDASRAGERHADPSRRAAARLTRPASGHPARDRLTHQLSHSPGVNSRWSSRQAAEHVRPVVVVAPRSGRAVVRLRDPDVGHALEEPHEGRVRLGPGERGAGAGVDAVPERRGADARWPGRAGTRPGTRTGAGRGSRRRSSRTRWFPGACRHHRPSSGTFDSLNEPFSGASVRSISSMNGEMSEWSSRSRCWNSGWSPSVRRHMTMSRAVVSPPAENRLAAIFATSSTGGSVPSGKVACAISVMMSSRGLRAAVLDVAGELVVQEAERLVLHLRGAHLVHEVGPERVAVLGGHAEEVRDHHDA